MLDLVEFVYHHSSDIKLATILILFMFYILFRVILKPNIYKKFPKILTDPIIIYFKNNQHILTK